MQILSYYCDGNDEKKKGIFIFNPIKQIINEIIFISKEEDGYFSYYIVGTNIKCPKNMEGLSNELFSIVNDPKNINEGYSFVGTFDDVITELEQQIPNILEILTEWNERLYFFNNWNTLCENRYVKELCSIGRNPIAVIYDSLIQEFLVYEEFKCCYATSERLKKLMHHKKIANRNFKPLFSILYVNANKNNEECYYKTTKHGNTEFRVLDSSILSQYSYEHLIGEFVKFN